MENTDNKEYQDVKMDDATLLSDLITLHEKALTEFQQKFWDSAEENKRFTSGTHWSDAELKEIEDQELLDYSIPVSETKIAVQISQQMSSRTTWRCLGREPDDELNAEIKTSLMSFVEEYNDFEFVESDIYADGIGKKYGVVKRYTDYTKDAKGKIMLKRIPYNQVMWDLNCKDYNIPKNASWMQEFEYFSRQQMKEMYPEHAETIDRVAEGDTTSSNSSDSSTPMDWVRTERGLQMLKRVIHYQRRYKTIEVEVPMGDPADNGVAGTNVPQMKKIPRIVEYIEMIVFTKDATTVLSRDIVGYQANGELVESDMHILHPYFSFADGVCLMDYLKKPQKFLDRITMQLDRSVAKMIKSSYTVVQDLLHDDSINDWANISKEMASGGAMIKVKNHDAIRWIESGKVEPELFTMWQMVYKILQDITGGQNAQGLKETASESGVAVQQRREAAMLVSYVYIDNLRRWKKTLGEGVLENIDEVYGNDRKSAFRVLGNTMSKDVQAILEKSGIYRKAQMPHGYGFMMLSGTTKPLGETKTDVIVSGSSNTPQAKDRKLQQMLMYFQMKAQNGEKVPPISLLFPYMDIDPTVKLPIEKWEQEQQAREQEMLELEKQKLKFQGNMAIADQTTKAAKVVKDGDAKNKDTKMDAADMINQRLYGNGEGSAKPV